MADDWERINEALGAEMQGRSLAPHVSRQTLFGIQSTVEAQMAGIAADVARGSSTPPAPRASREKLAGFAQDWGARLIIGRADRYYIFRARQAGYDIPAYPFSAKGELAQFLADEGAADVPSWYEGIGVGEGAFRNLAAYALVALGDGRGGWHERLVAHAAAYVDAAGFEPLSEDRLLDRAPAEVVDALIGAIGSLIQQLA